MRHFAPFSKHPSNLCPPPLKAERFDTVLGPLFFNLHCDRTSTLILKQNAEILSHVTGAHLEVLWLVWQEVDEMSKVKNQSLMMGHTDA
jgi:hypothetical protein